jgi:hypothetical protein
MQSVAPLGKSLAFDHDVIGEGDVGAFVGSGAPDLPIGNQAAEDFAALHHRAVIGNTDIGEADALRDVGCLTFIGKSQHALREQCGRKGEEKKQNKERFARHAKPPEIGDGPREAAEFKAGNIKVLQECGKLSREEGIWRNGRDE